MEGEKNPERETIFVIHVEARTWMEELEEKKKTITEKI